MVSWEAGGRLYHPMEGRLLGKAGGRLSIGEGGGGGAAPQPSV